MAKGIPTPPKRGTRYWLMKSEPSEFGIDDLKKKQKSRWDGIRNYQVRNMLRDEIQVGDYALFYHSNAHQIGVVGEMRVIQAAYPDPTQFDQKSDYFDPQSQLKNPRWLAVNVKFVCEYPKIVTLSTLKISPFFKNSPLVQKGNRLSIIPLTRDQYEFVSGCAR
jgi:predicted RNA-binding protein with PUA-like domain